MGLTDNRCEAVARNRRDTHLETSAGPCNLDWPIRVFLGVPPRHQGLVGVRTHTDVCLDTVEDCPSRRRYFLVRKIISLVARYKFYLLRLL